MLAEAYRYYNLTANVIIPVPLHQSRFKERGFNQSTLLAKKLSRLIGLPVDTATLYRTRDTGYQMALKAQQRRQNVAGAFDCRGQLSGLRFLLVDDVCTTGSTLDACAMALKMNGADTVWGLTLAKAR
ncbi:MAG: ComF family protein [Anaerolineae bacterium]|nr:ComF family protein [Anaerolineae bacterium]